MTSRYDTGPYGVNNYSASTTHEAEEVVNSASGVLASAGVSTTGDAAVSGVFSAAGVGNLTASGWASVSGEYTLYADPQYVRQSTGEANMFADFSLSVFSAVEYNYNPLTEVSGEIVLSVDPYIGLFWKPSNTENTWFTEAPLSDVWVKQPQINSPWSN